MNAEDRLTFGNRSDLVQCPFPKKQIDIQQNDISTRCSDRIASLVVRPAGRHGNKISAGIGAKERQPSFCRILNGDIYFIAFGDHTVLHIQNVKIPADDRFVSVGYNAGTHGFLLLLC